VFDCRAPPTACWLNDACCHRHEYDCLYIHGDIHGDTCALTHACSAFGSDCGIVNVNIPTNGAEIGGAFGMLDYIRALSAPLRHASDTALGLRMSTAMYRVNCVTQHCCSHLVLCCLVFVVHSDLLHRQRRYVCDVRCVLLPYLDQAVRRRLVAVVRAAAIHGSSTCDAPLGEFVPFDIG
jgi:hypothetical protein